IRESRGLFRESVLSEIGNVVGPERIATRGIEAGYWIGKRRARRSSLIEKTGGELDRPPQMGLESQLLRDFPALIGLQNRRRQIRQRRVVVALESGEPHRAVFDIL